MKKIIAFLAACVLAMSALAALAEDPAVYLALGDSITTGYGLAEGEMCFAELVAQANGYALINRAVNGNTAAGILAQLADPATLMDVLRADVITITCGGNDMMGLLYQQIAEVYNALIPAQMPMLMVESGDVSDIMTNGEDPRQQALLLAALTVLEGNAEMGIEPFVQSAAMREGLTSYLTTLGVVVMSLRRANPEASIIVATQYNPYARFDGAFAALNAGMESGASALSGFIRDYAAVLGYQLADVYAAFSASGENLMNACMEPLNLDFHPNAAGHALIAEVFNAVLNPAE